ncbi:MAG: pilus assembly FimT family protein [Schwartzia sp. (in: firmicutes)]
MRERGFSLLEIVLTVGILGTLATFAIPVFARWGGLWQLEYEAARLASEVRYYREVMGTFTHQHPDFLSVSQESTPIFGFSRHEYYLRRGGKLSRRHSLPDGIRLSTSRPELIFSLGGDAVPISFCLQRGMERRYVIIDIAGRVRVSRFPPE